MKTHQPLPDELRYLQPFVRWLAKRSPDDANESIDATRLEKALRKRVRGMSIAEAQQRLDADRRTLQSWLEAWTPEGHPAHWVLGFLTHPKLAKELLQTPADKPPEPIIEFDPPAGWHVRAIPFNLNLRKGKERAFITVIGEFSFHNLQVPGARVFAQGEGRVDEHDVQFGQLKGKKYLRLQTAPVHSRQLDYVLAVPGGFANIILCRTDGGEFDEIPFEAQLQESDLLNARGQQVGTAHASLCPEKLSRYRRPLGWSPFRTGASLWQ
jgi:hypothetical protein